MQMIASGWTYQRSAFRVIAAIAELAMLPANTAWAAGWSNPVQLAGKSFYYDTTIDAAGDSLVAWNYYGNQGSSHLPVSSRIKPAGSLWQSPQLVPPSNTQAAGSSGNVSSPKAHIASSGTATVVYQNDLGVWTADRSPNQAWQQAIRISASNASTSIFRTRFNSAGDGVIAWEDKNGFGSLYISQRRSGGAWGAPVLIAVPQKPGAGAVAGGVQPLDVALAEDGSAVVAFAYFDVMHHSVVNNHLAAASTILVGSGNWPVSGTLMDLASYAADAVAAASSNGLAAVVGLRTPDDRMLAFNHPGAGSTWSAPTVIGPVTSSYPPSNTFTITFAADNAGHASLLSIDNTTNTLTLTGGNLAQARWSAPIAVSSVGQVQQTDPYSKGFSLGVAPDGFLAAAWWTLFSNQNAYVVTQAAAGGALSAPAFLAHATPAGPGIDASAASGQKAVVALSYLNSSQTYQLLLASTLSH